MDPERFEQLAAAFRDAVTEREKAQSVLDEKRKAEVAASREFRAYVAQHAGLSVGRLVA